MLINDLMMYIFQNVYIFYLNAIAESRLSATSISEPGHGQHIYLLFYNFADGKNVLNLLTVTFVHGPSSKSPSTDSAHNTKWTQMESLISEPMLVIPGNQIIVGE